MHPGYGFLSESAEFARAVLDAGLTWVGPAPASIEAMGSKIRAKELMRKAGVPVLEAPTEPTASDLPLLVKASAGGGGRGMRVVRDLAALPAEVAAAEAEAASAFGDGTVFVEPYVERGRHVEVQVVGTAHGVLVLGERDCSLQRRHQKVVEETPAPHLPERTRRALHDAARKAAARDRLPRCRHGRVPLRPGAGPVLLPGDEHPAPGRAPGHRARARRRPGRDAARRRGGPRAGAHRRDVRSRDRGAAVRRGPRRRLPAAERHAHGLRRSRRERRVRPAQPARGPARLRVRPGQRGLDPLRRDAGQGGRLGARPRAGRAAPGGHPGQGTDPRRHHQPRPARGDAAGRGVPRG